MPKQTYAQKKPHIYKWVANNREKYNEIQRVEMDEVYNLVDICKLTTDKLILDHYIGDNF